MKIYQLSLMAFSVVLMASLNAFAVESYKPKTSDYAIWALTNSARSELSTPSHPIKPLAWNDNLGRSSLDHSQYYVDHQNSPNCPGHNCGGSFYSRIYPIYGAGSVSENGAGGDAEAAVQAWLEDFLYGHRAALLGTGWLEMGGGVATSSPQTGSFNYSTQHFGNPSGRYEVVVPALPGGAVLPRLHYSSQPRKIMVNYYDINGDAPTSVKAIIDGACVHLPLVSGKASQGTYQIIRPFDDSKVCRSVVFQAVRRDGTVHYWPENGNAIVIGVGMESVNCPEFMSAPTVTCGASVGGAPAPNPNPNPNPVPNPVPQPNAPPTSIKVTLEKVEELTNNERVLKVTLSVNCLVEDVATKKCKINWNLNKLSGKSTRRSSGGTLSTNSDGKIFIRRAFSIKNEGGSKFEFKIGAVTAPNGTTQSPTAKEIISIPLF